jgi:hypothetical protein
MSAGSNVNLDVVAQLPPDIKAMLRRKSSRDPNSRFTSKLATLLHYVTRFPASEEDIGIRWVDDVTFKMKKRVLISILGIKLNTLNVNLRDLKFVQQPNPSKDGWTYWKKDGFTQASALTYGEDSHAPEQPLRLTSVQPAWPFSLGCVVPEALAQFFQTADLIWRELTGPALVQVIETQPFLQRAAYHFKQGGQHEENALEVLTAIIAPKKSERITFEQFTRFLAMFGPEKTVMLKIASLLDCSHRTGQWLYFDTDGITLPALAVSFDTQEPNCLIIRNNGNITRVWNVPLIEANEKNGYVYDEVGHTYGSWSEYFERHPVGTGLCDILYAY